MNGLVDENASALLVPGTFPVAAAVVGIRTIPVDPEPSGKNLPQLPGFQCLFDQNRSCIVTVLKNNAKCDMIPSACIYHPVCIRQGNGHWFLRQNMNPVVCRINRNDRVQIMGCADMHGIQVFPVQHFLIIRVVSASITLSGMLRTILPDITYRSQLCKSGCFQGCQMNGGNGTTANEPDPELFHVMITFESFKISRPADVYGHLLYK